MYGLRYQNHWRSLILTGLVFLLLNCAKLGYVEAQTLVAHGAVTTVLERLERMQSEQEDRIHYANGQAKLEILNSDGNGSFEFREYHVNGKLKTTGQLVNGRLDGAYQEYYPDGELKLLMNYADGRNTGVYKEYYNDGALKKSGRYEDGKLVEGFRIYFKNGKIQEDLQLLEGQLHGAHKLYYESGVMKQEAFYVDGKLNGAARVYDPNGHLQVEMQYVDDLREGSYVEYYDNRNIKESGSLQDGKLNGLIKLFSEEGLLVAEMQYVDGVLDGKTRLYNDQGALREIQTYINGNRTDVVLVDGTLPQFEGARYLKDWIQKIKIADSGKQSLWIILGVGLMAIGLLSGTYYFESRNKTLRQLGAAGSQKVAADSPLPDPVVLPTEEKFLPVETPADPEPVPEKEPDREDPPPDLKPNLRANPFPTYAEDEAPGSASASLSDTNPPSPAPDAAADSSLASDKELNMLLPESQNLHRKLMENVVNGIFLVKPSGVVIYANHAFVTMFGYATRADVMGRNIITDFFNQKERFGDEFLTQLKQHNRIQDFELKYQLPEGSSAIFSVNANFIWNDKGEVIAIGGVVSDRSEQYRLEQAVLKEKYKLEHILEFGEDIDNIRVLTELISFVTQSITDILESERCSIMLEKEDQLLHVVGARGMSDALIESTKVKLGDSIAGTVALQGQPLLVRNIEYDETFRRAKKASYLGRSFMVVPFKLNDKQHGVINVADKRSEIYKAEPFDELDFRILKTITAKVATALENVMLFTELNLMTVTDPLTQIYNYRRFSESLDQEIRRMKREEGDLCVIMMDLDKFKSYNDSFGHVEGDELLRQIGTILKTQLRETDIVCRYAGDEFCIVLPNTTIDGAKNAAEKVKQAVEDFPFKRKITFSLGIARYKPELNKQELIVKADKALYEAKNAGRNCIKVIE